MVLRLSCEGEAFHNQMVNRKIDSSRRSEGLVFSCVEGGCDGEVRERLIVTGGRML